MTADRKTRIAVEEAFATPQLIRAWKERLADPEALDPGFASLFGPLLSSPRSRGLVEQLVDVGDGRLAAMDRAGIDMQVLSVAAPGVQVFAADVATALSVELNDQLAEVIRQYPARFSGLAAIAPQSPKLAARELERAVSQLGLRGAIVNSHTGGKYLDDSIYFPIFEAAESLGVPIYLHPNTPAPQMIRPYSEVGLEGPLWGFAAETSLHALRLIFSGVFDQFPRLLFLLGHLGEGLPFWLPRIDSRYELVRRSGWRDSSRSLDRKPSEYFFDNIYTTTSGMNWPAQVKFCLDVLGAERLLFAADHPYESAQQAVELFDSLALDEEAKAKICYLNARRVLAIPAD